MDFEYRNTLSRCNGNSNLDDESCEVYFVSKDKSLVSIYTGQTEFGCNKIEIKLICQNNIWKFLVSQTWCPNQGYNAEGTYESIEEFNEVVKIISNYKEIGEFLMRLLGKEPNKPIAC